MTRCRARLGSLQASRALQRNDALLETLLIGVVVFPGTGISSNLGESEEARHSDF